MLNNNINVLYRGWRNSPEYLELFKEEINQYLNRDISENHITDYDFTDTVIVKKVDHSEFIFNRAFYVEKVLPVGMFFDNPEDFEGETDTFYAVLTASSGYFLFEKLSILSVEQKPSELVKRITIDDLEDLEEENFILNKKS